MFTEVHETPQQRGFSLEGWGSKVIDRLSKDLKEAFPGMSGFSPRNLKYMRKFAGNCPDISIVQRTVAQIPWSSKGFAARIVRWATKSRWLHVGVAVWVEDRLMVMDSYPFKGTFEPRLKGCLLATKLRAMELRGF